MAGTPLPLHFVKGPAVRVIGAAETDGVSFAHIDMHGPTAGRTFWPFLALQQIGALQAELPTANLTEVALLAARGFPVPVDGIRLAARAEDSVYQFALRLSVPFRPAPSDAHVYLGYRLHLAIDIFKGKGVVL
jgi:hypothetical protein